VCSYDVVELEDNSCLFLALYSIYKCKTNRLAKPLILIKQ